MLVISSREFRNNQKNYFDQLDQGVSLLVKRGRDKLYKISPVTDEDILLNKKEYLSIPDELRSNPFQYSPTGDLYFANIKNIDALKEAQLQSQTGLCESPFEGETILEFINRGL